MSTLNPMTVSPGKTGIFVYLGELIPNQILLTGSAETNAAVVLTSYAPPGTPSAWSYWAAAGASQTSLLVKFPASIFQISNSGTTPVTVGGDGIFPYDREKHAHLHPPA